MYIHKRMAFTTAKLSELPLRNTLPFTCSHSSSSPSSIFKSPKHCFSIPITFSSLKTTQTHKNPHSNSSQNPSKTPNSAPWIKKWPSIDPSTVQNDAEFGNSSKGSRIVENKGKSAIERIVNRLRSLGLESDDEDMSDLDEEGFREEEKLGDLLKRDWIRNDTMLVEEEKRSDYGLLPWEREEGEGEEEDVGVVREVRASEKKAKRVVRGNTLADLTIEESELKRLRGQGMVLRDKVNVPKAGLTRAVLEKIHTKWKKKELVRLRFHEDLAHDMKTAHILVERRTGGLVIWRSGSVMVVYRGKNYEGPLPQSKADESSVDIAAVSNGNAAGTSLETISPQVKALEQSRNLTAEEVEYNELLDCLGPRFVDWWGTGILPVDGDLLPQTVPGFKPPLRLLPTGMRLAVTNAELTTLRKLAKSLPCHFALGRNRHHQGLAAAIIKLWEKSLVAKIAVKRGIQNTNNELMSEELKALTGGTLLLRNKFFIVIYRGKDFLPRSVASAVLERQELTKKIQDAEETARIGSYVASSSYEAKDEAEDAPAGTLAEFYEAQARWGREISAEEREKMIEEASTAKSVKEVKRVEHKLALAQSKKLRAETLLAKIEASMVPVGPSDDLETITDEERFTFRRIGLSMKAYLPLGVRGIFDGVIENMHLHWKHRELVKLITKQKTLAFVEETARLLEYESGGILVAIERVPKGYAIIYYRGKNYQRPVSLRPRNLLTKAKAFKRAIAMQRHEALSQHIAELESNIDQMKNTGDSKSVEDGKASSFNVEFGSDSEISQGLSMINTDSGDEEDDDFDYSDDDSNEFASIEDQD
ncbi:CRM-domain containing factor CFM3, chloroplastic/mitochondrial-like [Chenopodium quinoa]|uniref:CRM-domain containing factor CFM3, chloroplastic/mitochondrial-like n=1 Tax=Chenopodium quinoa TaxID=63459 RepID=UPI000B789477|nr:CRM-domain containing factor CFM3, chloroplastic/mitochondrial-like [Chenopodium quinoa]XP_021736334.1 CRM-domain containing factor CFM3, chloroplastic/mitochondrial-like [Chenopodium quinoa]